MVSMFSLIPSRENYLGSGFCIKLHLILLYMCLGLINLSDMFASSIAYYTYLSKLNPKRNVLVLISFITRLFVKKFKRYISSADLRPDSP